MQEVVSVWLQTHGESWGKTPSLCSVLYCSSVLSNLCHNAKSFRNVFSSQIGKSDPGSEWRVLGIIYQLQKGNVIQGRSPIFCFFLYVSSIFCNFLCYKTLCHITVRFEIVHRHINWSPLWFWLGLRVGFGTSANYFYFPCVWTACC